MHVPSDELQKMKARRRNRKLVDECWERERSLLLQLQHSSAREERKAGKRGIYFVFLSLLLHFSCLVLVLGLFLALLVLSFSLTPLVSSYFPPPPPPPPPPPHPLPLPPPSSSSSSSIYCFFCFSYFLICVFVAPCSASNRVSS